jgi:hypothetical protein
MTLEDEDEEAKDFAGRIEFNAALRFTYWDKLLVVHNFSITELDHWLCRHLKIHAIQDQGAKDLAEAITVKFDDSED